MTPGANSGVLTDNTSTNPWAVSISATAGDCIVLAVQNWYPSNPPPALSISGTQAADWLSAATIVGNLYNNSRLTVFVLPNVTATGTLSISIDFGGGAGHKATGAWLKATGQVGNSGIVDIALTANGNGTNDGATLGPSSATSQADELAIAVLGTNWTQANPQNYTTTPSGYTSIAAQTDSNGSCGFWMGHKVLSAIGAQTATFGFTANVADINAALVTLKGLSGLSVTGGGQLPSAPYVSSIAAAPSTLTTATGAAPTAITLTDSTGQTLPASFASLRSSVAGVVSIPAGNDASGQFLITPTAAGSTTVTATYNDPYVGPLSATVAVTVTAPAPPPAPAPVGPQITTTSLPGGVAGSVYTATVAASSPSPIVWSLAATKPAWLSINPTTGALSGTLPTTAGDYTAPVIATNATGATNASLIITVAAAPAVVTPTVTTVSAQSVRVFQTAYQMVIVQATLNGLPVPNYTLTGTAGAGLTLVNTTAVTAADGTASFLFTGTAAGATTLTVTP